MLGQWLETVGIGLPVGDYVADIVFAPRADAGGGSVLSSV